MNELIKFDPTELNKFYLYIRVDRQHCHMKIVEHIVL